MKFTGYIVQSLLWLSVAISPTLLGLLISAPFSGAYPNAMYIGCFVGFIIGAVWAEKIRKSTGLDTFLGKLIGHPDIDGHK